MLKRLKICICMIMVLSLTLLSYSFASTAIVNTKVLNVRNEPTQSGTKIGTAKDSEKYDVLDKSNNWVKINFNSTTGWISSDYVVIEEDIMTEETNNEEEENNKQEIKYFKKVTTSILNVRASNSASAQKIGSLKFGTEVQVLETISNWDRVVINNLTGWVCNDYLVATRNENLTKNINTLDTTNEHTQTTVLKTAVINTSTLNVREQSTTASDRIGTLKKNAIVAIIGEENGWYKIKYNNQYGYILSDYTVNKDIEMSRGSYSRGEQPTTVAETATTLALQYIGCKYVWGRNIT